VRASRRGNKRDDNTVTRGRLRRKAAISKHFAATRATAPQSREEATGPKRPRIKVGGAKGPKRPSRKRAFAARTAAPQSQDEAKAKAKRPKKSGRTFGGIKGALAARAARQSGSGGGLAGVAARGWSGHRKKRARLGQIAKKRAFLGKIGKKKHIR